MDRGAWRATSPKRCKESDTTEATQCMHVHMRTHTHVSQDENIILFSTWLT